MFINLLLFYENIKKKLTLDQMQKIKAGFKAGSILACEQEFKGSYAIMGNNNFATLFIKK